MNLKPYTGRAPRLDDMPEIVQRAYEASVRRTVTYYGEDTVDSQMTHDQVRLCAETAEALYGGHTPVEVSYVKGSRPQIEQMLAPVLKGVRGERERMLAVGRFVRDIYQLRPGEFRAGVGDVFHGGAEEEVIKKGSTMCNEQARVFCVCCQVAGIPARYVGHYVGGHGVNEAFVDGAWAYFDIRGKYFYKPDGRLASAWELMNDPSLIEQQSDATRADILKGYNLDSTRRYFSRVEVTVITNYFACDAARYGYGWIWLTQELKDRVAKVRAEFPDELSAENVLAMVNGEMPWPK